MRVKRALVVLATLVGALVTASSAGSANECDGLMVCIPIEGPWVVVPTSGGVPRPEVEYQLTCPRRHIVGGLDARLSDRAIDVSFLGTIGSPVNPGISTSRSVVFVAAYVGASARAPTFKPFIGCMPATGGGARVPTSVTVFPPGQPTVRRVKTARMWVGGVTVTVAQRCAARERLVGASHAVAFATRTPPSARLVAGVSARQSVRGREVVVTVRADVESGDVRPLVQVHAVCAVVR